MKFCFSLYASNAGGGGEEGREGGRGPGWRPKGMNSVVTAEEGFLKIQNRP